MAALRQLDASGATLGGGGSQKHSFNSFATQLFTFSQPTNATYQDLQVAKVSFDSTLVDSSNVKIDTFIFKEAGNVSVGDETIQVPLGAVKFNVELSNWSWCGGSTTCKAQAGEGAAVELDLSMAVVGKGSPTKMSAKDKDFDLGGGNKLLMFDTYSLDSGATWVKMPTGYPKVSGSTFTLKFPRWTGTVMYDPIVAKDVDAEKESSSAAARNLANLLPVLWMVSILSSR